MDEYVTYIKGEEGVEENYMTVGDWVDSIVEEAVEEKDAIIAAKETEIARKDTELAQRDTEIAQRDTEIARLKEELEKYKK